MARTTVRDLAPWAVIAIGMGLAGFVLKPDVASDTLVAGITAAATYLTSLGSGGATVTAEAPALPRFRATPTFLR